MHIMLFCRLAVLGLLGVTVPLYGAPWTAHGPAGVGVTALAGNDSTLYAGSQRFAGRIADHGVVVPR